MRCTQTQLGYCTKSCNMMEMAARLIRWQGYSPQKAAQKIQAEHCPAGTQMQIERGKNQLASLGFGQRREENWEGTQKIR